MSIIHQIFIYLAAGAAGFLLFKVQELLQASIRKEMAAESYFKSLEKIRKEETEAYQEHLKISAGFQRRNTEAFEITVADRLRNQG